MSLLLESLKRVDCPDYQASISALCGQEASSTRPEKTDRQWLLDNAQEIYDAVEEHYSASQPTNEIQEPITADSNSETKSPDDSDNEAEPSLQDIDLEGAPLLPNEQTLSSDLSTQLTIEKKSEKSENLSITINAEPNKLLAKPSTKEKLPDKKLTLSTIQKTVQKTLADEFDDLEKELKDIEPAPELETPFSKPSDQKQKKPTILKKIYRSSFYPMAPLIVIRDIFAGSAGVAEFFTFVFPHMHQAFFGWTIFAISTFFGLVCASITAVFDVKLMADELDVSYFTICKNVESFVNDFDRLRMLQRKISQETTELAQQKENGQISISAYEQKIATITAHTARTQTIHNHLYKRLDHYLTGFAKIKTKRRFAKYSWYFCTIPYYVGVGAMLGVSSVGMFPSLHLTPLIPSYVSFPILFLFLLSELYRWSLMERPSQGAAVNALFGYPNEILERAVELGNFSKTLQSTQNSATYFAKATISKSPALFGKTTPAANEDVQDQRLLSVGK